MACFAMPFFLFKGEYYFSNFFLLFVLDKKAELYATIPLSVGITVRLSNGQKSRTAFRHHRRNCRSVTQ